MGVLDLLKKVKVQTLSFEKHPCRDLEQEQMIHYLNGLALVTKEDGNICEKEREYLSILINSFGLSEDMLETFVNFAENPEEKLILDMMQSFATKDIKYNFMVDAMMTASIDGNFDASEEAIIEQYFEMFKITKDEEKDLRYIYEMFYTQDGNGLYRYFGIKNKNAKYTIKPELFQYLLEYYEIDMAYELQEEEKKLLDFEFFKPTFKEGELGNGATEIMTKPVNNAQFCIYLNYAFMDKKIEIDGNGKVVDSESKDLLMDLDKSDIYLEDGKFIVDKDKYENRVTGITYVAANLFIAWASGVNGVKYGLTSFTICQVYMDSFSTPIFGEFYYGYYNRNYNNYSGYRRANNKYYSQKYFSYNDNQSWYDGYSSSYDPKVDENYTSKETSFRMMKLPVEAK